MDKSSLLHSARLFGENRHFLKDRLISLLSKAVYIKWKIFNQRKKVKITGGAMIYEHFFLRADDAKSVVFCATFSRPLN